MPEWNREKGITELTRPHKHLHALLHRMGFEVEDEVAVARSPKQVYRLDCYVREINMAFECDGKRVHAGVKKQQKDQARDQWIFENAGIPVMRIQADALQFRLWDDLEPIIRTFVEENMGDLGARQAKAETIGV